MIFGHWQNPRALDNMGERPTELAVKAPHNQIQFFQPQGNHMLFKFKSKNGADVIMVQSTGEQMLEIIGKHAGPTGIIQPPEMPAAIAALQSAMAAEEKNAQSAQENGAAPPTDEPSLRQRAVPFIDMLRRCQADGDDVVWGV